MPLLLLAAGRVNYAILFFVTTSQRANIYDCKVRSFGVT
jgi:hypothetical protein